MIGYIQMNLRDALAEMGEAAVKAELSHFSCPRNADVEAFIQDKAIEFARQGIAATHLVYRSYRGTPVLVGYYALANKMVSIKASTLNAKWRSRVNRFARLDLDLKRYMIAMPLIGQLAKNYADGHDSLITGDQLLSFACDKIKEFQLNLSGKMAYLECEDAPGLIAFYERNGFYRFANRNLDGDEIGEQRYLVQMIRYFSDTE
ncbi:MAG: N-acetyltransferase [Oscillospiraceae bacterium]|nr:N-acetyltransferase [Oscillospiraceae bacterium]